MIQNSEVIGREAELQVRLPNGRIKCTACARLCEIPDGKTGLCGMGQQATAQTYQ
jgi:pyruvate formate lyase activating enzyme